MSASSSNREAIDAALLEMERARVEYNRSRDLLAQQLSSARQETPGLKPSEPDSGHVRQIAELRWELAGKPEGTAEDDWYRAEEIVRRATAA